MDIKSVNNINQLVSSTKLFLMSIDAYMSRLDLLRNSLELTDTNYSYKNLLTGWTYYGITSLSAYQIFSVALPATFEASVFNTMYYSLYNMPNLLVYPLGEVTTPTSYGLADTDIPLWWSYDATKLYLYIPSDGLVEDKYSFWLPISYTAEEYNIFFSRAHMFYMDFKEV
jgi:hypothetical protein